MRGSQGRKQRMLVGASGSLIPWICRGPATRFVPSGETTRGCGILRTYDCAQRASESKMLLFLPWGPRRRRFSRLSPVCFYYRKTEGVVVQELS